MGYVGIVLISHSEKVATGIKEMIRQVLHDVPVEVAGGTDEGKIGTSIDLISLAIERADKGNGVLLFYDLGSAKMNAEMAIELSARDDVKLVEAPLVEGSYVAAVESSTGKTLNEIIENVRKAFS